MQLIDLQRSATPIPEGISYLDRVQGIHYTMFQDARDGTRRHICGHTRRGQLFVVVYIHCGHLDTSLVPETESLGPDTGIIRHRPQLSLK